MKSNPKKRPLPLISTITCASSFAVVAAVVFVTGRGAADESPLETEPMTVAVNPAAWQNAYEVSRRYVGQVQARQRVDLAFELAGTVFDIQADDGQRVRAEQRLAELDTKRLQADRERFEGTLSEARADLELAKLTLARTARSFEAGGANQQEVDEARLAVDALIARVDQIESDIDRVDVDLGKSELRAPFDAIVAERHADEGTVVSGGAAVLTLLEVDRPEVRIGLPPVAAERVGVGDEVTVYVRDLEFVGTVSAKLPELDRRTRTAEVVIELDERLGDGVRDGDPAEIQVERIVNERGFWMPVSSLTQSVRGLWALYIAVPDGDGWTLERREVEALHTRDDRVFVRGPISGSDLLVDAGKHRLVPRLSVRPAEMPTKGGE